MTVLLEAAGRREALRSAPRGALTTALRQAVEQLRGAFAAGGEGVSGDVVESLLNEAEARLRDRRAGRLRRVINATGIVLHTGLGRAVLGEAARARLAEVAAGYSNLEIDLESG